MSDKRNVDDILTEWSEPVNEANPVSFIGMASDSAFQSKNWEGLGRILQEFFKESGIKEPGVTFLKSFTGPSATYKYVSRDSRQVEKAVGELDGVTKKASYKLSGDVITVE